MKLRHILSIILFLLVLVLALALGMENAQLVTLNVLFVTVSLPLSLIVFSAFIFGVLFTLLNLLIQRLRK